MDSTPSYYPFYRRIVRESLAQGLVTLKMSVLVVCGGETDRKLLQDFGFSDVTISNLDSRMSGKEFAPFKWSFQDAESLTYADDSFDLVIACAGLHHCHSPHRALLEIYRVARRCAVALEARDGVLSRVAARLGVVDEYEITAVAGNDLAYGGLKNTSIPNYIYRWTEREIAKTIASYAPYARHEIQWFHEFDPPFVVLRARKTLKGLLLLYGAYPALWLITRVFKSQCNLLGFAIRKPDFRKELFPWLKLEGGKPAIHREWVEERFKRAGPQEGA